MLLSLLGRPVDLDLSQVSAATAEGLERAWAQCAVPAGAVDPGDALRTRLLPPGTPREEVGPGDLVLPRLDADVYVPGFMKGIYGTRRWMAALLGAEGGKSSSPAKAAAARTNGAKGGRPRKQA